MENKKNILKIILLCLGVVLVAVLGSVFSAIGNDWYNSLTVPTAWVPPYLFSVVWTFIYITFCVFIIYAVNKKIFSKKLLILSIINGVLNVLWSLVFFGLSNILLGLVIIVINLIYGFILVKQILKTNLVFGLVLQVYAIWLAIATCLNIAIWVLN